MGALCKGLDFRCGLFASLVFLELANVDGYPVDSFTGALWSFPPTFGTVLQASLGLGILFDNAQLLRN